MSLSQLIQCLKSAKDPLPLFKAYRGLEWKNDIYYSLHASTLPHSQVLWKTPTSRLVLSGWSPDQTTTLFTNYGVVHTLVLEGQFYSTIYTRNKSLTYKRLTPHMYYYAPPHVDWTLSSTKVGATLHLYQTSYLY